MATDFSAFRLKLDIEGHSAAEVPLDGLHFAVKDVIMELADPVSRPPLDAAVNRMYGLWDMVSGTTLSNDLYADWLGNFNRIRPPEIWDVFGDWITRTRPRFGPQVASRFDAIRGTAGADTGSAQAFRRKAWSRITELLRDDTVLLLPTTPGPHRARASTTARRTGSAWRPCA